MDLRNSTKERDEFSELREDLSCKEPGMTAVNDDNDDDNGDENIISNHAKVFYPLNFATEVHS